MDYKIMFIDEEATQHEEFVDHFENYFPEADIKCVYPTSTIEEMLLEIENYRPHAVVADYQLNDKREGYTYNVCYNGVELVKAIRKQMLDFPCFVMTSHDLEAVNYSDDVNLIYIKKTLHYTFSEGEKVPFAQRVKNQIDNYFNKIASAKIELKKLIDKREKGNANIQDEERLIELDSFLEKTYDAKNVIPEDMKTTSNLDRLNLLIDKVDELIRKIE